MLEAFAMAPPDPILGLTETFKADVRPEKINLGVGVFKDANGATPVLASVKLAETLILEKEHSKDYLAISGAPEFGAHIDRLLFGDDSSLTACGLTQTAQVPGGTAALRVACDLVRRLNPAACAWASDPTWVNHINVFRTAGLEIKSYPYYDFDARSVAFERMRDALNAVPPGDLVLLHACCHNPSGMDPTLEQWSELAALAAERKFLTLFDCAYQGFGLGLDHDVAAIRVFAQAGLEFLVASSYSKNFGLYNERVGGLTVVATTQDAVAKTFSQIKALIRANYSNPPHHGAAIVQTILSNRDLAELWKTELTAMRTRIHEMRLLFAETMARTDSPVDFSFITRQLGMFSFLGLTREQVLALREQHAIYIVESSRINVAGMTPDNMPRICRAIADVTSR